LYSFERKGVAKKGVCKTMKTKGEWEVASGECRVARTHRRYPPPRVFCEKRLYFIDFEGVKFFQDDKEAVIY
jgi:hypothetical protein